MPSAAKCIPVAAPPARAPDCKTKCKQQEQVASKIQKQRCKRNVTAYSFLAFALPRDMEHRCRLRQHHPPPRLIAATSTR
mmetsp:Transcript_26805/g.67543  ORF Transcript_26805/g.67543 Transcript_26805/m.67543 type:complete len:80 (+) Transcript_26805:153-392(+)